MLFLGKPLSEITEDDLQELVRREIAEADIRTLEYKLELPNATHPKTREFLSDVVSFSGGGGVIIFGVVY